MVTTQISYAKIFLQNIKTQTWTYTNATGSDVTLPIGTAMGIVYATSLCVECLSTATDGSQKPYAVLMVSTTIAAHTSQTLTLVSSGDVDGSLIVFNNGT